MYVHFIYKGKFIYEMNIYVKKVNYLFTYSFNMFCSLIFNMAYNLVTISYYIKRNVQGETLSTLALCLSIAWNVKVLHCYKTNRDFLLKWYSILQYCCNHWLNKATKWYIRYVTALSHIIITLSSHQNTPSSSM